MQVIGLPRQVIRNGRAVSRLLAAKTPDIVAARRRYAVARWREAIGDGLNAERAERGLVDANLGGGLMKQRVARKGQGRRGGYRLLMAFKAKTRAVFVYGFAKNERDNIGPDELDFWRRVAGAFSVMTELQVDSLVSARELTEAMRHGED